MEQNELLLKKLQTNPNYRAFQDERKIDALGVLLFSVFFFGAVISDITRSVTHDISVRIDVIFIIIALVCIVVSIGLVFISFVQKKPVFVTNGVIKEVQQIAYRSYEANWYLVSDDTNQEYWGKSPSSFFTMSMEINRATLLARRYCVFRWVVRSGSFRSQLSATKVVGL